MDQTQEMMRKILILASTALVLSGCSGGKKTEIGPEETLQRFYKALCTGEYAMAESLCDTLHMKGYIDGIGRMMEQTDSTVGAIVTGMLSETKVSITDMRKDGNDRTIAYELKSVNGRSKAKTAVLTKEEGEWRIREITDRQ